MSNHITNIDSSSLATDKAFVGSAAILQDIVMTAYSITGSLSAATELCSKLADDELQNIDQAVSVLARLHQIAMKLPKH